MHKVDLQNVDLNLLVALEVLLEEELPIGVRPNLAIQELGNKILALVYQALARSLRAINVVVYVVN